MLIQKAMKKINFAAAILVIMLATGCTQKNNDTALLKLKNDSLTSVSNSKEQMVIDFVNAFNEIQANLDSIKVKEKIIFKSTNSGSELKTKAKEQIINDINQMYKLQEESKVMIANLRVKLKKTGLHTVELERMTDNLSKQIADKDVQIAQLRTDLSKANVQVADLSNKVVDLNTNVSSLSAQNEEKQKVIEDKTAELNTAYYVIGTTDYLKEKNIVTKEGGVLGLGKTKELTAEVDKSSLTRVDVTQLDVIPIMKSKVAILTTHPKNSYRLTGKHAADSLVITDKKEFWSLSKVFYLFDIQHQHF
jgi:hypothetical protein